MTKGYGVHVATIVNKQRGKEYKTTLLRRTFREGAKVKHQTLANLSKLPDQSIKVLRASLKGEPVCLADDVFKIKKSFLHGHAALAWQMMKKLSIDDLLGRVKSDREAKYKRICLALIASRVIDPKSKLATTSFWQDTTLGSDLVFDCLGTDEVYEAHDWLLSKQDKIEKALADRHLEEGGHVLYDVSSSYLEGRTCPLAGWGYPRDKKKGKRQVVYGLIADKLGRPIAVSVFGGGTADTATVGAQIDKLKTSFGIKSAILVGDRGMITQTRIDELKSYPDINFVTAIRAKEIQKLTKAGYIQLSLFDKQNLAEITHPDYPNQRLIVCRNPQVAEDRKRTREELIAATIAQLEKIVKSVDSRRLKGIDKIGVRVGRVINRFKMAKHFDLKIQEQSFSFSLKDEQIVTEASLDGVYVLRTDVDPNTLKADEVVFSYKSLAEVETAFRSLKTVDLKVRPINHRLEDRVRAHIFLCMLSYYVAWHLKAALKPLTFADEHPSERIDPVAKAQTSVFVKRKAAHKMTNDGYPVLGFRGLLDHLATLTRNVVSVGADQTGPINMLSEATPLQKRAFELIDMPIPVKLV